MYKNKSQNCKETGKIQQYIPNDAASTCLVYILDINTRYVGMYVYVCWGLDTCYHKINIFQILVEIGKYLEVFVM